MTVCGAKFALEHVMKISEFSLLACGLLFAMQPAPVLSADSGSAGADNAIHSLEDISNAVEQFVIDASSESGHEVTVSSRSLDSRLRLARCVQPLIASWAPGSHTLGRVTVQVECTSDKPWRIRVQATVTMEELVWQLERAVKRGDILDKGMLSQKTVVLGTGNSIAASMGTPIVDIDPWIGYAFTRRVGMGKILNDRMLEAANVISKGDVVLITHRSNGLTLQTKGIAMNNATANQQVQIKNSASGRIVDAIAVAEGVAQILR